MLLGSRCQSQLSVELSSSLTALAEISSILLAAYSKVLIGIISADGIRCMIEKVDCGEAGPFQFRSVKSSPMGEQVLGRQSVWALSTGSCAGVAEMED